MSTENRSDKYKHNMVSETNNWADHRAHNRTVQTRQVLRAEAKPWKRRTKK